MAGKPLMVIADDYVGVAEMLGYLIETLCGCETATAANGAEAVEIALARQPFAVVLDLDMPVMGGVDAARELRRRLPEPLPLLIALSGGANLADARASDVFDHAFAKPADIVEMSRILSERLADEGFEKHVSRGA